ncbi:hypothetical protein TRICI_005784 [Trichomonascus ciferrii]|uniref:Uncharacterized protein n=1 Tax=Trichomonascus ciferrii TaxID=44093 RepID=A0A642UP93_9ASCO|nr:hypothetical protein TRICI_005784 [Trichomonascus ciferrii]
MASATTTAQSLKLANRQPPPENISIPPSPDLSQSPSQSASPSPTILRDFDRYPNNYSSKTVSMIMNSRVEPSAILDARVEEGERSLKTKLASGKLAISGPEGFTHVAHKDPAAQGQGPGPARGPPVRAYRDRDSSSRQQPSASSSSSSSSSWRFSSRTSSVAPKESNRKSRLPWKRQTTTSPSHQPKTPSISEPILEYSTSELVPETSRQQRSSVSSSSKHSRDSGVQSPVASSFEDPRPQQQQQQQLTTNDILEIHKWRQRLRESEDQRRSMVIEYQQKLDAERQRNLELTKKLEEMKVSAQTNTEVVKPASDSEVQARIKALESQRDVLREALNTLRQTKELEMNEYKMQQHKKTHTYNRFSNSSKSTLVDDRKQDSSTTSSSSSSTVSSPEQHFVYRTGIRPLLPTANPVEMP